MSATGDVTSFMEYFSEFSPREVQLEGKPQQLHRFYLSAAETEFSYEVMILGLLGRIYGTPILGDVLIFLPGEAAIRQIYDQLSNGSRSEVERARIGLVEYLMLFRDLPIQEQDRITIDKFDDSGIRYRKVILSTNMAETSITLKNLTVCIDTGENKMPVFDPDYRGSELLSVANSRAQADQRAGRAGRRQEGMAFACFTEDEYKLLPSETMRPLSRADLTLFVLKVLARPCVEGDLRKFDWFSELHA